MWGEEEPPTARQPPANRLPPRPTYRADAPPQASCGARREVVGGRLAGCLAGGGVK